MTDFNSTIYKICLFFKDIFYEPTMNTIQVSKSPKEDAPTTVSSLVTTQQHTATATLNDQPLKAATATDHRQINTGKLSDDISGGFEDGSCTSTAYMLRPIFDRQSSRKRSAPDDDGSYDKSALPLNSHRPVNNAVCFNSNTPMPTAQLGNTAIGSLPLAWRTANQDGYQKPSNNINIARRNRCNNESNFHPPPHYHYHNHPPVQTMAPGFNHNPGSRTANDRPTQYILQHNDGRQEVKYAVPPNRPFMYPNNLVDNNIDSLLR